MINDEAPINIYYKKRGTKFKVKICFTAGQKTYIISKDDLANYQTNKSYTVLRATT
jgi:hypothetical protein